MSSWSSQKTWANILWSSSHPRKLDGVSDVQRGAAFLCQFGGTADGPRLAKVVQGRQPSPLRWASRRQLLLHKTHAPMRGTNGHLLDSANSFGCIPLLSSQFLRMGAGCISPTLSPSHVSSVPLSAPALPRHSMTPGPLGNSREACSLTFPAPIPQRSSSTLSPLDIWRPSADSRRVARVLRSRPQLLSLLAPCKRPW